MQPVNRKWYGDKLWYLLNLESHELKEIFSDQSWDNLKNKRKLYRKKIKDGKEVAPARPENYHLGDSVETIKERLGDLPDLDTQAKDELFNEHVDVEEVVAQVRKIMKDHQIKSRRIKSLKIVTGSHRGYIKNADNEIEYTDDLPKKGVSLIFEPRDFEPKWDMVQPPLADIHPVKAVKRERNLGQKICVVLPDPQIGYRKFPDGSVETFHDPEAISIALQIIADLKPEKVVCLGDYLDLPMFGRFEQTEEYSQTAQMGINYGYKLLAKIRATVPDAEIAVIEGNHDRRLEKNISQNVMAARNLRQAEVDAMESFPVFSIPHLLKFEELGIKYIEGYPAGRYWINERLQCIHGHIVNSSGSTASRVVRNETVSTIFGHVHRIETVFNTQNTYMGGRANLAHTPGCLCRIDGRVPGKKGSTGLDGKAILNYENWQQGLTIVTYADGDNSFNLESIYINTIDGHRTVYGGKVYLPIEIEGLDT